MSLNAQQSDSAQIRQIFDYALTGSKVYEDLHELCTEIGGRLSGSPEAERAVYWAKAKLEEMGLDSVWLQPVMVPHWVRGEREKASFQVEGAESQNLPLCALGGSIGTNGRIRGEVIEVFSLEEVDELGEQLRGKIVLYNRPMEARLINTFEAYSGCVDQRSSGAARAGKYGAQAVLVRSMNLRMDDFPHTGVMRYDEGPRIPAAAISTNAAAQLSRLLHEGNKVFVELEMNCENLPDAPSFNVIGEIWGSEKPEEIIVVGGHLDSWDLAQGAHDDGAGSVQSMEVLRSFKALGLEPRHTVRCVLFMNEENGARGAREYARVARENEEKHILALESDRGGFTPRGFTVDGNEEVKSAGLNTMRQWLDLMAPYGIHAMDYGYSGVDINFLKDQGPLLIGFVPDSQRYFDYHHALNDNIDAVNRRELELGSASMVSLLYLLDKYQWQQDNPKY